MKRVHFRLMQPDINQTSIKKYISTALLFLMLGMSLLFFLSPNQARNLFSGWFSSGGSGTLVLGTASKSGAYYQLGDALRSELMARSKYTIEVLETAGSVANLEALAQGKCDVALIQSGLSADLREYAALAKVGRQYVHLIVPKDSDIKSFRDLAGKRVGLGSEESGFANLGQRVFGFFDFTPAPELIYDHRANLEEAFLDGEIDAAFTVYGLFTPAVEDLLHSGWYTLLPIPESAALARYLPGTQEEILPHSLYGPDRNIPYSDDSNFLTLAVDTLLVARNDTEAQAVTALLGALYEAPYPREARLNSLTEAEGQQVNSLPLHEAAKKFYARKAPLTSDHFEIASFFLAGMLFLASLTHYLLERRKRNHLERQRRAIVPYFNELLEYGQRMKSTEQTETLMQLTHEMMATQHKAEEQWLAGVLNTEHMENLYAVYNIRIRNAFSKITKLQLQHLGGESPHSNTNKPPTHHDTPWPPSPEEVTLETETAPEPTLRETGRHPLVQAPVGEESHEEMVSITDVEGIGKVRIRRKITPTPTEPEVGEEEALPSEPQVEENDDDKNKPQLDLFS